MKKKLRITEEQASIIANINPHVTGKKIQITLEQLELLSNTDFNTLISSNTKTNIITVESLLGHPIAGSGTKDEYKPQSEEENEQTFNESVINEGGIVFSLLEFAQEIIVFLKDLLSDPSSNGLSTIWVKMGVGRGELISMMLDLGLIGYVGNKIIVNRKNFKQNIKRLYGWVKDFAKPDEDIPFDDVQEENISLGDDMEIDEDYPVGTENDPSAPWNEKPGVILRTPKTSDFNLVFKNSEIAIFAGVDSKLFLLSYGYMDSSDFADYSEREETFIDKDEDGDPMFEYGDFEVDGDTLERYVNDGNTEELVYINGDLKEDLLDTYQEPELVTLLSHIQETTVAGSGAMGGSSGPFVTPINAKPITRRIGEAKIQTGNGVLKKKKDGSYQKVSKKTAHYKGTDDKLRNCGACKSFNENKCVLVKGSIDKQFVCDGFEKKDSSNESTTSASSGAYVTTKTWAKSKGDWRFGNKPAYPGGEMVENFKIKLTPEQVKLLRENDLSGGGFVKFDDCTKLNNNKVAQNGGCGKGDDGVVTVTDDPIYAETAKITGKSIEEVKRIIKNIS